MSNRERKTKHITFSLNIELIEELKKYCNENGYKVSTFVNMVLKNELEKRKEE